MELGEKEYKIVLNEDGTRNVETPPARKIEFQFARRAAA